MKYVRIYFYGILAIILLAVSAALLDAFLKIGFSIYVSSAVGSSLMAWILISPIVLYFIYRNQKGMCEEKQINPVIEVEQKVHGAALTALILGILNIIPTISFFGSAPILIFCIISYFVFSAKGKKKSARFSLLGTLFALAGLIILLFLMNRP